MDDVAQNRDPDPSAMKSSTLMASLNSPTD
jgi:hypothetical protein